MAAVLRSSAGGVVVAPGNDDAAADAVLELLGDEARRADLSSAGRRYAEATFNVATIADRFEAILLPERGELLSTLVESLRGESVS